MNLVLFVVQQTAMQGLTSVVLVYGTPASIPLNHEALALVYS
jgi:hypothetical protein